MRPLRRSEAKELLRKLSNYIFRVAGRRGSEQMNPGAYPGIISCSTKYYFVQSFKGVELGDMEMEFDVVGRAWRVDNYVDGEVVESSLNGHKIYGVEDLILREGQERISLSEAQEEKIKEVVKGSVNWRASAYKASVYKTLKTETNETETNELEIF